MKRLAEEEFGVEFKFDSLINPRIDCSQSPLCVRISPEKVVELDFSNRNARKTTRRMAEMELSMPLSVEHTERQKYTCGGGVAGCAIDPNGTITLRDFASARLQHPGRQFPGKTDHCAKFAISRARVSTICDRCQIQSLSACALKRRTRKWRSGVSRRFPMPGRSPSRVRPGLQRTQVLRSRRTPRGLVGLSA